ncbi:MAG: hypothetical protein FD135_1563 [Comamonadaceae bacterium]|nr:MAG: hypothetical protein FD135_1563 [Comamonadaceae bacterium]
MNKNKSNNAEKWFISKSTKSFACTIALLVFCVQGCTRQDNKTTTTTKVTTQESPALLSDMKERAAILAAALGKPRRLLIGLGSQTIESIQAQQLKPDIYDQYINRVGKNSWINWNTPQGSYIQIVTKNADALGAVPMFTLYQMASLGDGNISGVSDPYFMQQYWNNVRILYRELKAYDKPALVNFEPDFWGYTQRQFGDPANHFVHVNTDNPDCADQPNNMIGFGHCLLDMARSLAPKAYVGFPPSLFPDVAATELSYMKLIGAGKGDFVVMQTSDRDAGCFESRYTGQGAGCDRSDGPTHSWDYSNQSEPNFTTHLAMARQYFKEIQKPLIWWQTPLGVPSPNRGGRPGFFRDNKMDYFLTHPEELVAAGAVGIVFSSGHTTQTNLETDQGQFKRLSEKYLKNPVHFK